MSKKVIALGDLHCGHIAGLTPPAWMVKKDRQKHIRKMQEECWSAFVKLANENNKPDLLIANGDLIDGRGNRSGGTELVTSDRFEQCDMAVKCLQRFNAKKVVITYGTAYHSGDCKDYENIIADKLEADIKSHQFVDVNGLIFDVKHHISSSSVPYGRHTAVAREKLWNMLWSAKGNQPEANVVIRSHVHYHAFCGSMGCLMMTLPALQAAETKYGARRCSGVVDWGMVVFDVTSKGEYKWHSLTKEISAVQCKPLKA
jgi:hypothetical protein